MEKKPFAQLKILPIIFFIFLSHLFVPISIFAQQPNPAPPVDTGAQPQTTGAQQQTSPINLPNPIGITDPRDIIATVINAVLGIVGSIALAVFIFGGVIWMTSAGNQERISKGKTMIVWATIGLAVIFTSYIIVRFVIETITSKSQ